MATIQKFFPTYVNRSVFEQKMLDILFAIPAGQEFSELDYAKMSGDFAQAISNGRHLQLLRNATESCYRGNRREDGCELVQLPGDRYIWK